MTTASTETTSPQADPTDKKGQRSVKNLLIDRRFQLKYTLLVVLLTLIVASVMGVLLYNEMRESSKTALASLNAHKDIDDQAFSNLAANLAERDARSLLIIVAGLGGLVIVILGVGIWMSHKISGPIYIISRYLNEIAEGRLSQVRPLRKGDELRDFFESFQTMVSSLSSQGRADLVRVSDAISKIEGGDPRGAVPLLREMEQEKRDFLG